ncbi:hypothetical protein [Micromonospora craniellae]|uniref:hypothetical protein n=1 Tax=Micromonospora craniellae TaxID=2294034 RepID=UPI0011C17A41|nr:hypothetical protein [Micromonospora craniellae]
MHQSQSFGFELSPHCAVFSCQVVQPTLPVPAFGQHIHVQGNLMFVAQRCLLHLHSMNGLPACTQEASEQGKEAAGEGG